MSTVLVIAIPPTASIDADALWRECMPLVLDKVRAEGYEVGRPDVVDSETITVPLNPSGQVIMYTTVGSNGIPMVSFTVEGLEIETHALREIGAYFGRTYGTGSDVA